MAKTKHELGYRDLVPTPEAVKRTVQWLANDQAEIAARTKEATDDIFDYKLEDQIMDTYQQAMKQMTETLPEVHIERRVSQYLQRDMVPAARHCFQLQVDSGHAFPETHRPARAASFAFY